MAAYDSRRVDQDGVVSLWLGNFASEDEFDSYFEEHYDEDGNADPLNQFAADTNLRWYDHDFQEAEFSGDGPLSVREFLAGFSYSSSFIDAAVRAAEQAGWTEANAVFLLYDCAYKKPDNEPGPMKYIGTFPYDKNAAPAE